MDQAIFIFLPGLAFPQQYHVCSIYLLSKFFPSSPMGLFPQSNFTPPSYTISLQYQFLYTNNTFNTNAFLLTSSCWTFHLSLPWSQAVMVVV